MRRIQVRCCGILHVNKKKTLSFSFRSRTVGMMQMYNVSWNHKPLLLTVVPTYIFTLPHFCLLGLLDEQSHKNSFMWQPTHSTNMMRTRRRQPNLTLRSLVIHDLITLILWQLRTWKRSIYIVFHAAEYVFEASFALTMSILCTEFVLLIWWRALGILRSLPGQSPLLFNSVQFNFNYI